MYYEHLCFLISVHPSTPDSIAHCTIEVHQYNLIRTLLCIIAVISSVCLTSQYSEMAMICLYLCH